MSNAGLAVETLLRHGTLIVFGWVFAVQVGAPVPAVPLLVAVGVLGPSGTVSVGWALLAALGGSMVADLLWYGVGRRWGDRALRAAAVRRARALFLAHRLWALVIAKFLTGVNAPVAALAGSSKIRVGEFLVYDAASALLWAGTWVGVGYVLKRAVREFPATLAGVWLILEIAVLVAAFWAVNRASEARS